MRHQVQIETLEQERNALQRDIDNAIVLFTETTGEKEIRSKAEKRIEDLDSSIQSEKREIQKSTQGNKEQSSLTRKLFNIALDASAKEINRTRKLIMSLHKVETTARNDRKALELALELSLDQMDDLEKEYLKA